MKIAAVTEDGVKLSSHFGMAPSYRVLTIEGGKIVADEIIEKPHHESHGHKQHGGHDHHEHDEHAHTHELHVHEEAKHDAGHHHGMKFFDPIKDCQVLICGGMGDSPYQRALSFGFEVLMTGGKIDAAVAAYLNGELTSDARRIHQH
jgi:predicted Fe-Mo cluster-binding NifX family protein